MTSRLTRLDRGVSGARSDRSESNHHRPHSELDIQHRILLRTYAAIRPQYFMIYLGEQQYLLP